MPDQQFFESDAFAQLATQEDGHFWFEERNLLLEWCLRRFLPECRSFCEIGCGTGFVSRHLESAFPEIEFVGAEFFTEALQFATRRAKRCRFLQTDARFLPFQSVFDGIGAFDVLEHIDEDEQVLQQFHRALRPAGGLILTVPQHRFLWSSTDEQAHHKRRYSRGELLSKVTRAGFRPVLCTSFVTSLLPFMLASRWLNARDAAKATSDPAPVSNREFDLPPLINRAFRAALAAERLMIRGGIRFPAGGSLVLVAIKQPEGATDSPHRSC